jgi:hypothetical protein
MATAAAAIAGAIASILGTGASVYGTATRDNSQAVRQNDIAQQGVMAAQSNDAYQRALSVLINQRSIAGGTDQYGSSFHYDPATNQWVSSLGPQPKAVQDAADLASISRNTTDLRQAQEANRAAMTRATQAQPVADSAIRNLRDFTPMPSTALTGLLQQRATDAARATFDPLVSDTLRSYQRTGTAAGPVLAELGRTQFNALRDSLADAQIKGLSGVDAINQSRRGALEQSASNANALATPQFQYPGITPSTGRDTLASLVAARSQQGGTGPAFGAGGVNTANTATQAAIKALQGSVPGSLNTIGDIGKEISAGLGNKQFTDNLTTIFDKVFPGGQTGSNFDPTTIGATAGNGVDPGSNFLRDSGFFNSVNNRTFG